MDFGFCSRVWSPCRWPAPKTSRSSQSISSSAARPGSVIDVVTRQIAEGLATELRQPVVVENRFSGGGIVALQTLKSSPADGYTLSIVAMPQMSVSPSLFKQLPYDPAKDFTPIGILYRGPQFLVVNRTAHPYHSCF
ncbi:Bug family tripartite tricarboxylate transporter substrate binding protein [Variovorax sp. GT1P44]|uniref:Bug family tripartite tricarboxylate transporter substrate binding protein n=1 Tax=Variovorax sp. GT1P44 TaxID=3443742 RepID=UPI003F447B1A